MHTPPIRRIVEGRKNIFTDTPSRLFPPPLEKMLQLLGLANAGMDDQNNITDVDFAKSSRPYFCGKTFSVHLLTTSPWAGSQTICPWLTSWSGSARLPRGAHWTKELQDYSNKGLYPGENLRMEFRGRAFSNRRSS